jgi:hypothetical protein
MKQKFIISAVIFFICFAGDNLLSQSESNITYETGTTLEIEAGADMCAANIIINGTYSGTGTICDGVMPVTMLSFTSQTGGNNVILNWTTAVEVNNSGFSIERKLLKENSTWNIVSFIKGAGTSSIPQDYSYTDKKLNTGTYQYRIKQIDFNGNYEYFSLVENIVIKAPGVFSVSQNYPNPSNPSSIIEFQIPAAGMVTIKIYNVAGREVATLLNEFMSADFHSVKFDGSNLSSGVYFYTLASGRYNKTNKMILVK